MNELRVIITGDRACFTRPEMKVERVTYEVPTPGALEGLLKGVYWKPSMRYVIDEIVVFNPIRTDRIMTNEIEIKSDPFAKPVIYAEEHRIMRSTMFLKNVKYGVKFHIELTGLRNEEEAKLKNPYAKHENMFLQRAEKGKSFRNLYLGLSEFSCSLQPVDQFDYGTVCIENAGEKDLGFMLYRMNFRDHGVPIDNDWEHPVFHDSAVPVFYHPKMVNGVIDVNKYRDTCVC